MTITPVLIRIPCSGSQCSNLYAKLAGVLNEPAIHFPILAFASDGPTEANGTNRFLSRPPEPGCNSLP